MNHLESKILRAAQILNFLRAMAPEHRSIHDSVATGQIAARMQSNPRWFALITPNTRVGLRQRTPGQYAEVNVPAKGCDLVEVVVMDKRVLSANFYGDEVELFQFNPGNWEAWFDVDNGGDTVPVERLVFADPKNPEWQRFLESDDGQHAPARAAVDEPVAPLKRRRGRPSTTALQAPRPDEPYRMHSVTAP